jgi:integrase
MKMSDLFDLYLKEIEVTPRVLRDYKNMIFNFLIPAFGAMDAKDIKPKHVAAFINACPTKRGRVHRNRMVMILSSAYLRAMGSWCIDDDLINPCTPVRRHPTKPRDRYVTDAEFAAFRATVPPSIQIAMDLALLIGQRQGDILALKWTDIHDGELWIDQGKTGKKLAIGISAAVEAVLARARLIDPQLPRVYVVHTFMGRRYTADGFRALWQSYMKPWRRAHPEQATWTFHDIRAKAVSDNSSLEKASLLAGHIDQKITGRVYDRNRRRVEPLR